jgi:uncharacterized protein (DUF1330 family)
MPQMTDVYLTVTATPNPDNQAEMSDYLGKVMPLLMSAGGKPVNRFKASKVITGDPGFALIMIMAFPNAEAIETFFAGDEYRPLIPIRDKAFSRIDILIMESLS